MKHRIRKVTAVQQKLLSKIREFISMEQMPPTCQELADIMGYASANAVYVALVSLEKKGAVTLLKKRARGIRLTENFSTEPKTS